MAMAGYDQPGRRQRVAVPVPFDRRDPLAVAPALRQQRVGNRGVEPSPPPQPGESLAVRGYEHVVVRDDRVSSWLHAESHLVPWMGQESLLVDRYDARLLLEDANAFKKLKLFAVEAGELASRTAHEEAQLDAERYRDLPSAAGGPPSPDSGADDTNLGSGALARHFAGHTGPAVPFLYGDASVAGSVDAHAISCGTVAAEPTPAAGQQSHVGKAADPSGRATAWDSSRPAPLVHPRSLFAKLCMCVRGVCARVCGVSYREGRGLCRRRPSGRCHRIPRLPGE